MNLFSYKDLELSSNNEINTFIFNNIEIEVFRYLDAKDKYHLLMTTIEQAEEDGIYNDFLLEMHFHLNLILMYSNIEFSEEDLKDKYKLYDELESSGFIDIFVAHMEANEYNYLTRILDKLVASKMEYKKSISSLYDKAMNDLPQQVEEAKKLIEGIDLSEFENLQTFANDLGMNG